MNVSIRLKGSILLCALTALSLVAAEPKPVANRIPSFFLADTSAAAKDADASSARILLQTPGGTLIFDGRGFPSAARATDMNKTAQGIFRPLTTAKLAAPRLEAPSHVQVHRLTGPRHTWQTSLATYQRLVYPNVWPGISLTYDQTADGLGLRLRLAANADPSQILLASGSAELTADGAGNLVGQVDGQPLTLAPPQAYQLIDGRKQAVRIAYKTLPSGQLAFNLGPYRKSAALVIEPPFVWGTLLPGPGSEGDSAQALAIDASGNLYVAGATQAMDFPTTLGAYDTSWNGQYDIFVLKLDGTTRQPLFCTLIGGQDNENAPKLAVDADGTVYLAGSTISSDFPTTPDAQDTSYNGGTDTFFAALSADGTTLSYSTFLGGYANDSLSAMVRDDQGHTYLAGTTGSANFPVTPGAYDTNFAVEECFLTRLSQSHQPLFTTFLGGASYDRMGDMALSHSGQLILAGTTYSADFTATPGAYQYPGSGATLFVGQFNSQTGVPTYLALIGSLSSGDTGISLALDAADNPVFAVSSSTTGFPMTAGAYDTSADGGTNTIIAKLDQGGANLAFATYFGGAGRDTVSDLAIGVDGSVYACGTTSSADLPTTTAIGPTPTITTTDAFVCKLSGDGQDLLFSTRFRSNLVASAMALDSQEHVFLAGSTSTGELPIVGPAPQPHPLGGSDGFLAELDAAGEQLLFSTFIGGSGPDTAEALATDSQGNSWLLASTAALDLGQSPLQAAAGGSDLAICKFLPNGDLAFITYLGGSNNDSGRDLAVDANGAIYVTGQTYSSDLPTTPGVVGPSYQGNGDGFVAKLTADGTALVYATYLGGSQIDTTAGLALDPLGQVYLAGVTYSNDFIATNKGAGSGLSGLNDVFLAKLNATGTNLLQQRLLGGTGRDFARALAYNDGLIGVVGSTDSADFPVTEGGALQTVSTGFTALFDADLDAPLRAWLQPGTSDNTNTDIAGASEGRFVAINLSFDFDNTCSLFAFDQSSTLALATLAGVSSFEFPSLAIDSHDEVYVTGASFGRLPTTDNAWYRDLQGGWDAFLAKFNADGQRFYCSYLGGSLNDRGSDVSVDGLDRIHLVGSTYSPDFLTLGQSTQGASDLYHLVLDLSPPSILAQPSSITVCAGELIQLSVAASGTGNLSYQWFWNDAWLPNANSATLTIEHAAPYHAGSFYCVVSNGLFGVRSDDAVVTVLANAGFAQQPQSQLVCLGQSFTVSVAPYGAGPFTYQWYKDGAPLAGEQAPQLMLAAVAVEDQGDYHCVVSGSCVMTSRTATLWIGDALSVEIQPSGTAQGLTPLTLELHHLCLQGNTQVSWTNLNTGAVYGPNVNPLQLPAVLTETTDFEATVTDLDSGESLSTVVTVLVADDSRYLDLNGDGCNTSADLGILLPQWTAAMKGDPDGNSRLNLLDLLYINTQGCQRANNTNDVVKPRSGKRP